MLSYQETRQGYIYPWYRILITLLYCQYIATKLIAILSNIAPKGAKITQVVAVSQQISFNLCIQALRSESQLENLNLIIIVSSADADVGFQHCLCLVFSGFTGKSCPDSVRIFCPMSVCPDSVCLDSVRPDKDKTGLSGLSPSLSANVCSEYPLIGPIPRTVLFQVVLSQSLWET